MLVLTRETEQEIIIGGTIRVKVVGVNGGKVRLGVVAPPEVEVDRSEVWAAKLRERAVKEGRLGGGQSP